MVPLSEVLAMPSFRASAPIVMAGAVPDAQVRWVHSSEVYEMGALLDGGEVLLTSGLGLHGCSDAQLAGYVDQLADAGCTALALELGRSFLAMPEVLVHSARRRGLVLMALTAVVPFERHIEDFHELLLRRTPGVLAARLATRFAEAVIEGVGLRALLDDVARAAGCRVEYHDSEETLVERSRIRTVAHPGERTRAPVPGRDGARGWLVLMAEESEHTRRVAEQGATAVALELARFPDAGTRTSLDQTLIGDLHAGSLATAGEVHRRLREAGFSLDRHHRLLTLAIDAGGLATPSEVLGALRGLPGLQHHRAGILGGHVVMLTQVPTAWEPAALRERMSEAAQALRDAVDAGGRLLVAIVGPESDAGQVSAQVRAVRETLWLARRHGHAGGVVLARDLGLQRLLSAGTDAAELAGFVTEQLGPLIDSDRTHRAALVRTLDSYLRHNLSKSAAADELGVRRQSLYARLERIETLLGVRLSDAEARTRLAVALTAWRLETGLDPQSMFG